MTKILTHIQGVNCIRKLRQNMDEHGATSRELYMYVDGSYTNSTIFKNLPKAVSIIGRIRKDCRLHKSEVNIKETGRKKVYGEQIWKEAGANHILQMVVIRPLSYRLTKNSRLLYRNPTYLISTDNELSIEKLLQAYLWRWEIEVNFRDEKTILGVGKAQVRNPKSAESVPAFIAAAYSFMQLASHKAHKLADKSEVLPRAKWYKSNPDQRLTTGDIINSIRAQLWAKALGCDSFSGFVKQ